MRHYALRRIVAMAVFAGALAVAGATGLPVPAVGAVAWVAVYAAARSGLLG